MTEPSEEARRIVERRFGGGWREWKDKWHDIVSELEHDIETALAEKDAALEEARRGPTWLTVNMCRDKRERLEDQLRDLLAWARGAHGLMAAMSAIFWQDDPIAAKDWTLRIRELLARAPEGVK